MGLGHCVTDGPFANLQALYFGNQNKTHCLSRGFTDLESAKNRIFYLTADALEATLMEPYYTGFYSRLENGAHNSIPMIIRGDFYKVTAPYGKLFSILPAPTPSWFTETNKNRPYILFAPYSARSYVV